MRGIRSLGVYTTALSKTINFLGLDDSLLASDQWMWNDGFCDRQANNQAENPLAPRNHTRLKAARWIDPQFTHITASPMHHDVLSTCGDKADSFNSARDWAAQKYQWAGYFAVYSFTGNNDPRWQCDVWVASDGYYVLARD